MGYHVCYKSVRWMSRIFIFLKCTILGLKMYVSERMMIDGRTTCNSDNVLYYPAYYPKFVYQSSDYGLQTNLHKSTNSV